MLLVMAMLSGCGKTTTAETETETQPDTETPVETELPICTGTSCRKWTLTGKQSALPYGITMT